MIKTNRQRHPHIHSATILQIVDIVPRYELDKSEQLVYGKLNNTVYIGIPLFIYSLGTGKGHNPNPLHRLQNNHLHYIVGRGCYNFGCAASFHHHMFWNNLSMVTIHHNHHVL